MSRKLTPNEERFARGVARGLGIREAFDAAGYSTKQDPEKRSIAASAVMARPVVAARIAELRGKVEADFRLDMRKILTRLSDIALADPSELMKPRRLNCRHCYGAEHEFQWIDQAEWARAASHALKAKEEPPGEMGGFGFRPNVAPHPGCPKCGGDGHLDVFIADLANVSPQARKLFAGIKTTKGGVELKTHDQMAVVDKIIRILGGYDDKVRMELTGRDGGAIQSLAGELSPEAAAALYRKAMGGA